jgi:uncharacterized protein (DUF2141 family)
MLKLIISTVSLLFYSNNEMPTEKCINTLVDVEITVKKIKNTHGKLLIGIFKDNASFEKEKAFKSIILTKETLSNGSIKVKTQLEPGIYGASLLDDENDNGKMDYNFMGIPKEGFGFSNYYFSGFSKPKFQTFQFEVTQASNPKIEMVIRYM